MYQTMYMLITIIPMRRVMISVYIKSRKVAKPKGQLTSSLHYL